MFKFGNEPEPGPDTLGYAFDHGLKKFVENKDLTWVCYLGQGNRKLVFDPGRDIEYELVSCEYDKLIDVYKEGNTITIYLKVGYPEYAEKKQETNETMGTPTGENKTP